MKRNIGISLIVLVITIIIIIILAGTVILSLADNNPIAAANEATFKANVSEYNSELALVLSKEYVTNSSFDSNTFYVGVWDGTGDGTGTIKEYITSITAVDGSKFEIQAGKLVYVGDNTVEQGYITSMGLTYGSELFMVGVVATRNRTIDGNAAAYNNPIIPKGFKAIDTTDSNWSNVSTDWNKGLVIEDSYDNQFVWVPVDETSVPYSKWCTAGVEYSSTTDDTLPSGVTSESAQITNYHGFYIARYEAVFDNNTGNIRVASKKSTNNTMTNWSTTRTSTYNGYLWNYISYDDAREYSVAMSTAYGYTTVKTGLVTGTQWDTVLEWIKDSGKSVMDSTTWGNYYDAAFTYEWPTAGTKAANTATLLDTGAAVRNMANNIYDMAGNLYEWTNEVYNSDRVYRGGSCGSNGIASASPVTYRNNGAVENVVYYIGFRPVLYIF